MSWIDFRHCGVFFFQRLAQHPDSLLACSWDSRTARKNLSQLPQLPNRATDQSMAKLAIAPRDAHRPSPPWSYPHFPPPRSGSWCCICIELRSTRTEPPKVWPLFPLLFSHSFVPWIQTRERVKVRKWSWILHGAHSFPMMLLLPTRKPTPKRKQRLSPSSTKQPWAFHMHTGDSLYPTGLCSHLNSPWPHLN